METALQTYKAMPNPSDIFVDTENRNSDSSGNIENVIGKSYILLYIHIVLTAPNILGGSEPKGSISRKDALELFEKIFGQKGSGLAATEEDDGDDDENNDKGK